MQQRNPQEQQRRAARRLVAMKYGLAFALALFPHREEGR